MSEIETVRTHIESLERLIRSFEELEKSEMALLRAAAIAEAEISLVDQRSSVRLQVRGLRKELAQLRKREMELLEESAGR